MPASALPEPRLLTWRGTLALALLAVVCFHLAHLVPALCFLSAIYLVALFGLARVSTTRIAFWLGLTLGLAVCAPHLHFFWPIFGPAALALWLIIAIYVAFFLLLARLCVACCRPWLAALLIPCLWLGLEYFRSELYYLRFAWLTPGLALSATPTHWLLNHIGVYGFAFLVLLTAGLLSFCRRRTAVLAGAILLATFAALVNLPIAHHQSNTAERGPLLVGIQLEFPSDGEVLRSLDAALTEYPTADILVLSEYTFDVPVPQSVRAWCRENRRHLIAGGRQPVGNDEEFFNTVFVVDPQGDVVFEQAKCIPIQFFRDGRPALTQRLWQSPWGPLGICICYDLSYTRVTDELVRLGACAIICPAMDVEHWGRYQHELHARIAPARAAEYGLPVFRLCSSGISQYVASDGSLVATAPFVGRGCTLAGCIPLTHAGTLPWDRYLAPVAVVLTALFCLWQVAETVRAQFRRKPPSPPNA